MYQRGVLFENEIALWFVYHLDATAIATEWALLPAAYQEATRRCFRSTLPADMPVPVFGRIGPEERKAFRERAERLAKFLQAESYGVSTLRLRPNFNAEASPPRRQRHSSTAR
jgi:hypothetical protein